MKSRANGALYLHTIYLNICYITETQRDIHQKATDELADAGLEGLHLRWVTDWFINFSDMVTICNIW